MAPVYAAKYSNVPVWVSTVNNVSVMRRQGDGWVNATHLLKVADFDKPRRTRILERDVQTGEHEKVQGGYGKYQGTWIPVERAVELSKQVGILDLVYELLVYVPQEGVETAELPKQPKPVSASRKQSKLAEGSNANGSNGMGGHKAKRARKVSSVPGAPASIPVAPRAQPMQSLPPNMSSSYAPQMQWSPYSPHQYGQNHQQLQMTPQQMQQQMGVGMPGVPQMPVMPMSGYPMGMNPAQYQHGHYGPNTGDTSMTSNPPDGHYKTEGMGPRRSTASSPSLSSSVLSSGSDGFSDDERPYLGANSSFHEAGVRSASRHHNHQHHHHQMSSHNVSEQVIAAMRSSGVVSDASEYSQRQQTNASLPGSLQGPSQYMADYSSKLLDFFMSPDKSIIPATLLHPQPGPHINQPIDDEGNTAFHWTCAIGKIELMQALLDAGADTKILNHAGQTPLVRAVMFTNNYEARTFPRVLEMLADTASLVDPADRTILHHIASTASSSSRSGGARYYAEIILAKLSSSPELVPSGFSGWLDHQDQRGDTALHISSRCESRRLARALLSYHASPLIPNKAGVTAEELLKRSRHHRNEHGGKAEFDESRAATEDPDRIPRVPSSAAIAAKETSQAITRYLVDIGKTYDTDLANKDSDISQVRQLLDRIRQRVTETEELILKLQDEIGSEEQILAETKKLEQDTHEKANELKQLLERSQAKDLAILVQKEETEIQDELKEQLSYEDNFDASEQISLSQELGEMQHRRRSLLDEIVVLYSNAGSLEKIGKYRKLLALCCEVPEEEVDGLLDGITQALGTQVA